MSRVLVLDQSYQPISIVSLKKAIKYITTGKVEVIKEYNGNVCSTYLIFRMPAVVRFVRKIFRPRKLVKFSRANVYARDRWTCCYCGFKGSADELTFDHVIPRAKGGITCWENIVTACNPCNNRKADRLPQEAGMFLKRKPIAPDWIPIFAIKVARSKDMPDHWRDFCFGY